MSVPLVSYFPGMFANEPRSDGLWACITELEATCYHEAAHSVAQYVYGVPIDTVGVSATYEIGKDGGLKVSYGGEVTARGKEKVCIDYPYRRLHYIHGVVSAAGPAGERRYRYEVEVPQRLLGASEGDHRNIDAIAKTLAKRGRSRYAYQRLVWHAAQRLVGQPEIWSAVTSIGDDLFQNQGYDLERDDPGTAWVFMPGSEVNAWCRYHGLRRGMYRRAA